MSDRTYKVAVIGTGMIANSAHIPSYKALAGDVELVAVAILDAEAPGRHRPDGTGAHDSGTLDDETRQRGDFLWRT